MNDQVKYPPKAKLVTDPWNVFQSLNAARKNVLSIIPEIATKQPIVSGKTAWVRWHMVMDPKSLRRVLRDQIAANKN